MKFRFGKCAGGNIKIGFKTPRGVLLAYFSCLLIFVIRDTIPAKKIDESTATEIPLSKVIFGSFRPVYSSYCGKH